MSVIEMKDPGPLIGPDDIKALEKLIGWKLDQSFVDQYTTFNGGYPKRAYWNIDDYDTLEIQSFLIMKLSSSEYTLERTYKFGVFKGFLLSSLLPFANDHGGNYFCIDQKAQVLYVTPDNWLERLSVSENRERSSQIICSSFSTFINGLVGEEDAIVKP